MISVFDGFVSQTGEPIDDEMFISQWLPRAAAATRTISLLMHSSCHFLISSVFLPSFLCVHCKTFTGRSATEFRPKLLLYVQPWCHRLDLAKQTNWFFFFFIINPPVKNKWGKPVLLLVRPNKEKDKKSVQTKI